MKSTGYIVKSMYLTEDEKYYYPYNTEKIEKKDGVKVFGGLEELVPDVYLNYLLLQRKNWRIKRFQKYCLIHSGRLISGYIGRQCSHFRDGHLHLK